MDEEQITDLLDSVDREIGRMVVEGATNGVIARRLDLAEGTVKWRLHRMYRRLGVRSRVQFAVRVQGLLGTPKDPDGKE